MAEPGLHHHGSSAEDQGARARARSRPPVRAAHQQYFFDFVQQELIDKYGLATARDGGLKVYTTLDPQLQQSPSSAIAAHPVTGAAEALVSTDAQTGEIRAMASSESYEDSQFNLAAQGRRQPGSSFKPYALTAAVSEGIDPDATYYPAAASHDRSIPRADSAMPWTVCGGAGGTMNLRQALAHSVNSIYAQLAIDIGPEAMDEMAKKLGVTSPLQATRPMSWARATSQSSTRPRPTRPSPMAASTTTRPRSTGSSSPTATSTSPTKPRATG